MLVVATIGVSVCVWTAGWLLYGAARRLNESRDWMEHSQSVIADLQQETQRLDRIEPDMQLYLLTHDESNLRNAQSSVVTFYSSTLHLQQVVSDNRAQMPHAKELEKEAAELVKTFEPYSARSQFPANSRSLPERPSA